MQKGYHTQKLPVKEKKEHMSRKSKVGGIDRKDEMTYTDNTMSGEEVSKTIDASQSGTTGEVAEEGEPKLAKGALSKLNRLLSEEEMKDNPAAFKLILDKVDTLQTEVQELKSYRDKYHQEKTRADVSDVKYNALDASISSRSALILFGGILLGYLPLLFSNTAVFVTAVIIALVLLFFGFINVIGSAFSKITKK